MKICVSQFVVQKGHPAMTVMQIRTTDQEDGFCNCAGTPATLPFDCIGERNTIRSLFYDGISGNQLSDLTNDPSYPLKSDASREFGKFQNVCNKFYGQLWVASSRLFARTSDGRLSILCNGE